MAIEERGIRGGALAWWPSCSRSRARPLECGERKRQPAIVGSLVRESKHTLEARGLKIASSSSCPSASASGARLSFQSGWRRTCEKSARRGAGTKVRSKATWSSEKSEKLYNVGQWGGGYYSIAESGEVLVKPRGERGVSHKVVDLVEHCLEAGATLPLLLNFPDIVRDRICQQHKCFQESIEKYDFRGSYSCAFPIKANHSKELISALVSTCERELGGCTLEVGSKPELLIALSHACSARNPEAVQIVCNGFKDRKYMELALLAQECLGINIVLCIDRYQELDLAIACSSALGISPNLGVRLKLNTRHDGHWGSTSGYTSKFGLKVGQLLKLVARLKEEKMLSCLTLLHFHLGSQIDEISVVKSAMREACSLFCELHKLGAPLSTLDVGGGLAITYDGEKGSWHPKYSTQNYANDIVAAVNDMCVQRGIPAPLILTESGRSLASHHSVLIFNADCQSSDVSSEYKPAEGSPMSYFFKTYEEIYTDLSVENVEEVYNDALQFKRESESAFTLGVMSIEELAYAEELFDKIMSRILMLQNYDMKGEKALNEAKLSQAAPCFANLSIFRSAIDSWAISQSFPAMPVSMLHREPNNIVKLYDLTCDSDGEIKNFVTMKGKRSPVLPVFSDGNGSSLFGLFLLGAYQQSMGNYHNLFGKSCSVTLAFPECEQDSRDLEIVGLQAAETASEILCHADYSPEDMREQLACALNAKVGKESWEDPGGERLAKLYDGLLQATSYLEEDN